MSIYTTEELAEARRSIDSTLHKCEKALLKLTPGKSVCSIAETAGNCKSAPCSSKTEMQQNGFQQKNSKNLTTS